MAGNLSEEEQKEVVAKYQRLREEVDELYNKLSRVDSDRSEHELVIKSLSDLDGERRCWHQIGAVLAEKKVGEVLPVLKLNRDQFNDRVKQIGEVIQRKDEEIAELQAKYGIVVNSGN